VVGVADALGRIGPNDLVIVDGFRGEVTVAPTPEMIAEAEERSKKHIALVKHLREDRDRASVTADDIAVHLRANIEFPAEALLAVDHGSEGIGLYRTSSSTSTARRRRTRKSSTSCTARSSRPCTRGRPRFARSTSAATSSSRPSRSPPR